MVVEGLILAAGKVAYDMHKSDKLNEQAERKNIKSFSKVADAQIAQKEAEEIMNNAVLRLVNRKKAILLTSMKDFLSVYEKLIKINFIESDGIKELDRFTPAIAENIYSQISAVQSIPAIPTVTKNVITGYLLGGIFGAVSSSIVDDAQKNLDVARMQSKQANIIAQQAQGISLSYQAVTERASLMTDVLTKLNIMFNKGVRYTNMLIDKRGMDKRNYTIEDRNALAVCVNLAGAVKSILDTSIIDETGEITQKSMETIQLGEQCLKEIDFAIVNI